MEKSDKDLVTHFLASISEVKENLMRNSEFPKQFFRTDYNNQELIKLSLRMQNLIRDFNHSSLGEEYESLDNTLKEIQEDAIVFNQVVLELGYPPHGGIPADLIGSVVGNYKVEGIEEVKEYIDELYFDIYNDAKLDLLLIKWESYSILKNRMPILRNAIKCHQQQMYFSSIPTLLPQMEGIIAKSFKHIGQMNGKALKNYLKQTFLVESSIEYSIEDALHDFYLEYILVNFNHGEEIRSDLSRHAILHGGDYKYGTRQNSLKIILMFDYLSDLLEEIYKKSVIE